MLYGRVAAMKATLCLAILALTGCASHPMTFEQRMAVANYLQRSRYVLPMPQPMSVPQTRNYLCYVNGNYVSCSGN